MSPTSLAILPAALLVAPSPLPVSPLPAHVHIDPPTLITTERLVESLRALPVKRAGGRDPAHRDGLKQTEQLIETRLRELGYSPVLHEIGAFTGRGEEGGGSRDGAATPNAPANGQPGPPPLRHVWHNIIADLPGREFPSQVVILGAHFDAVPNCPGANDNGSGTAALLEIARAYKAVPPPRRTIRLAFFNLEEVQPIGIGLIGSGAYAADLADDIEAGRVKVVGVASMDTIGYFTDEPGSQTWPKLPVSIPLPTTGDFIAVGGLLQHQSFSQPLIKAMRAAAPDLHVFAGDILPFAAPDFLRSDHAPFLAMGIPAVIISDTANFRSPHYHRRSDTVETLDLARYTMTVKAIAAGVYAVADLKAQPDDDAPPSPARPAHPEPPPVDPAPHPDPSPPTGDGGLGPAPGQGPEKPR